MRYCSTKDCNNKYHCRGFCNKCYHKINKEKENIKYKEWYKNNKKKKRIYFIKNRDDINKRRRLSYRNSSKIKQYNKDWNKNHPEVGLKAIKKYLKKLGKQFDMTSNEYQYALSLWSKTIKKRDNYMCKNCGSKENLNAHHIKPKSKYPELSLDLDNGITLCEDCHSDIHGYKIY